MKKDLLWIVIVSVLLLLTCCIPVSADVTINVKAVNAVTGNFVNGYKFTFDNGNGDFQNYSTPHTIVIPFDKWNPVYPITAYDYQTIDGIAYCSAAGFISNESLYPEPTVITIYPNGTSSYQKPLLKDGDVINYNLTASLKGEIFVDSSPQGADIYVTGSPLGAKSPAPIGFCGRANQIVTIGARLDTYQYASQQVNTRPLFEGSGPLNVSFNLVPKAPTGIGFIRIHGYDDWGVYLKNVSFLFDSEPWAIRMINPPVTYVNAIPVGIHKITIPDQPIDSSGTIYKGQVLMVNITEDHTTDLIVTMYPVNPPGTGSIRIVGSYDDAWDQHYCIRYGLDKEPKAVRCLFFPNTDIKDIPIGIHTITIPDQPINASGIICQGQVLTANVTENHVTDVIVRMYPAREFLSLNGIVGLLGNYFDEALSTVGVGGPVNGTGQGNARFLITENPTPVAFAYDQSSNHGITTGQTTRQESGTTVTPGSGPGIVAAAPSLVTITPAISPAVTTVTPATIRTPDYTESRVTTPTTAPPAPAVTTIIPTTTRTPDYPGSIVTTLVIVTTPTTAPPPVTSTSIVEDIRTGPLPSASFTVDPATGTAPLFVKYDASGSYSSGGTITTYIWDFGDGTHGTGITGIHSYSNPGTYTIRLTVTDNSGLSGTVSRQVQINAPAVITTQQTLSHDQVIAHIGR